MTPCDLLDRADIELYFYDELEAPERASVEAHLAGCDSCRQALSELRVIRRALGGRPRVDAPPAEDWSGFMRRLDEACGIQTARAPRTFGRAAMAIAATLVLVTIGAVLASRMRSSASPFPDAQAPPVIAAPHTVQATDRTSNRALAELSEQHFERSKLVVLGLVARDPEHTDAKDWEYERDLAGSLLEDTRLYRRAAQDHGLADIAHVMGDLETVLLETSMSEHADSAALERVQRLIRKRDLVVKMQVVGSTGI
jgi:hypothetical protein